MIDVDVGISVIVLIIMIVVISIIVDVGGDMWLARFVKEDEVGQD